MPTLLYHITHVDNLQHILETGALRCYEDLAATTGWVVSIAHPGIQDRRARVQVPCGPEGTLHQYVPFYFAPRSPMLYTINRGNVEGYRKGQAPIIHIVSSVEQVQTTGHRFVFTDGHAVIALTRFFSELADLDQIDWDLMSAQYWYDTDEDPDRKRRRQAEFLVYQQLRLDAFLGFGVYNSQMQKRTETILAGAGVELPVRVRRAWYY